VSDPDVGLKIIELVVLHHLLGIAHDLQDEEIPSVRKDKSFLLPESIIVSLVESERVLVNKLVFCLAPAQAFESLTRDEGVQYLRLYPDKVSPHVRRPNLQAMDVAVIVDVGDLFRKVDVEPWLDEFTMNVPYHPVFEDGD
jgi:hypothetical protein